MTRRHAGNAEPDDREMALALLQVLDRSQVQRIARSAGLSDRPRIILLSGGVLRARLPFRFGTVVALEDVWPRVGRTWARRIAREPPAGPSRRRRVGHMSWV